MQLDLLDYTSNREDLIPRGNRDQNLAGSHGKTLAQCLCVYVGGGLGVAVPGELLGLL